MEHTFKKLKSIQPDSTFITRSRALILHSPQNIQVSGFDFLRVFRMNATFGVVTALSIFIILGGLSLLNQRVTSDRKALTDLDPASLNEEMADLDIQIQLSRAQYYEDSAEKIEIALRATSDEFTNARNRDEKLDELFRELTL